jgi:hypothetical protein
LLNYEDQLRTTTITTTTTTTTKKQNKTARILVSPHWSTKSIQHQFPSVFFSHWGLANNTTLDFSMRFARYALEKAS